MKSKIVQTLLFAGLVGVALASIAIAQVTINPVTVVHQNDLVPIIPYGAGNAQGSFANPGQIAGVESYQYSAPLTGFSIQALNATTLLYLNPAGTLATGTLLFAAVPSDGQHFCVIDSQTQSAITLTPPSGVTISSNSPGSVTALTAGTRYCWFFDLPLATWFRLS